MPKEKPLLNQVERIYEALLEKPRLYRYPTLKFYETNSSQRYQVLTQTGLVALLDSEKPSMAKEIPMSIERIFRELYWFHPTTGCYESLFDSLRHQFLTQVLSFQEEDLTEGDILKGERWLVHQFFSTKQHWEDWKQFEQYLTQTMRSRSEDLVSESLKVSLYEALDHALKDHLKEPLMLKSKVYQRLNQPLVLLEFSPTSPQEIRREIHQILQLDRSFFETITPQETILSQLVEHLEFIPQANQLPTWDYESVLDLLWEEFGYWIQDFYQLTEEECLTDTVQDVKEMLWDGYWQDRGLEFFVACCDQNLKAS